MALEQLANNIGSGWMQQMPGVNTSMAPGGVQAGTGSSWLNATTAMGALGMAGSLASAFGGSSSGSGIPTQQVKLTKEGEQMQSAVNSQMWKDWVRGPSQNLIASVVRPVREQANQFARETGKASQRDPQRASGGIGLASIAELANQRIGMEMQPLMAKQDLVKRHVQNTYGMGRNMMNVDWQVPFLNAQAQMYKSGRDVMRSGVQGQALSSALNMLGMMNYYNKRT